MDILIISSNRALWEALFPAFTQRGLNPSVVDALGKGMERIRVLPPTALILDFNMPAKEDRDLHEKEVRSALIEVLQVNASVHAAVVSFLDDGDFHDTFEGFGVLCRLPSVPGESDIREFAETLFRVIATMAT